MTQESNNYSALPDGSLLYDKPIQLLSPHWVTDPLNQRHYIPIVPPCTARRIELRVLQCGRRRADWKCTFFNRGVSVKDCHECKQCQTS